MDIGFGSDAYQGHEDRIATLEDVTFPDPNTVYSTANIGTWSSASDVDAFLTKHNHNNKYAGLALGNFVTIRDGTYNAQWEIAGFDMEYNRTASDGTVYNNGYGICMIPKTTLSNMTWNDSDTLVGAYMSSTMHTSHLVTAANNLKNVLGNHLINRNVLLSNAVSGSGANMNSSSYAWTTSYCTLMSAGQMTGSFAHHHNKYDDGEANYKLPVFDHEGYKIGSYFWSRGVWGWYSGMSKYSAWVVEGDGTLDKYEVRLNWGSRPLIYLR